MRKKTSYNILFNPFLVLKLILSYIYPKGGEEIELISSSFF